MSYTTNIASKTDLSGSITTGGVSQLLLPAGIYNKGFEIQNTSLGDLWINELGNAATTASPSLKIPAGALYETPINWNLDTAVYIIGAITGQTFTARGWL